MASLSVIYHKVLKIRLQEIPLISLTVCATVRLIIGISCIWHWRVAFIVSKWNIML